MSILIFPYFNLFAQFPTPSPAAASARACRRNGSPGKQRDQSFLMTAAPSAIVRSSLPDAGTAETKSVSVKSSAGLKITSRYETIVLYSSGSYMRLSYSLC